MPQWPRATPFQTSARKENSLKAANMPEKLTVSVATQHAHFDDTAISYCTRNTTGQIEMRFILRLKATTVRTNCLLRLIIRATYQNDKPSKERKKHAISRGQALTVSCADSALFPESEVSVKPGLQ